MNHIVPTAPSTQITSDAVRILAYCDMGDEHGLTLPDVQEDVQNHHYDVVMHCGDLAYDLWKGEGQVRAKARLWELSFGERYPASRL
jgi:hypothetical protein